MSLHLPTFLSVKSSAHLVVMFLNCYCSALGNKPLGSVSVCPSRTSWSAVQVPLQAVRRPEVSPNELPEARPHTHTSLSAFGSRWACLLPSRQCEGVYSVYSGPFKHLPGGHNERPRRFHHCERQCGVVAATPHAGGFRLLSSQMWNNNKDCPSTACHRGSWGSLQ